MLAEIAGGTVESTLTDWRGDPPRDHWSQPPVSMAVDLPDRTAESTTPTARTAQADADRREVTVDGDV
jgi:phenylalanyl-tRNA synthetase beta chain